MSGDKSIFSILDDTFRDIVKFENDSKVAVMEKGKVLIQTNENFTHTISDVLFILDLKTSLLSIGQLQEKNYEISIKGGACKIKDAKLGLIAQVKMTGNRMFLLYLHNMHNACFSAKLKDAAWLWHFRHGHLNFGGLKTLHQKNMVTGLPQITAPSDICQHCVVSKQHHNSFPQGKSWRAKKALELVHSDICEPITLICNEGKRYFITFIDDFSRKIWVYFLQEKSEAFVPFNLIKHLLRKKSVTQ